MLMSAAPCLPEPELAPAVGGAGGERSAVLLHRPLSLRQVFQYRWRESVGRMTVSPTAIFKSSAAHSPCGKYGLAFNTMTLNHVGSWLMYLNHLG